MPYRVFRWEWNITVSWVLCVFWLWLLCNLLIWWVICGTNNEIVISTAVIEGSDCLCHFSVRYFAMICISQQCFFFFNLSWETKERNKHSKSPFSTYKSEFRQGHMYCRASKGMSFGLNLWQEVTAKRNVPTAEQI